MSEQHVHGSRREGARMLWRAPRACSFSPTVEPVLPSRGSARRGEDWSDGRAPSCRLEELRFTEFFRSITCFY